MFDDLREESQGASFYTDDLALDPNAKKKQSKKGGGGKFLGLTAFQRMVLSLLLMMVACLGGIVVLIFTNKVVPF